MALSFIVLFCAFDQNETATNKARMRNPPEIDNHKSTVILYVNDGGIFTPYLPLMDEFCRLAFTRENDNLGVCLVCTPLLLRVILTN